MVQKKYLYIERQNVTPELMLSLRQAGWWLDYVQSKARSEVITFAFSKPLSSGESGTVLATSSGLVIVTSDNKAILITEGASGEEVTIEGTLLTTSSGTYLVTSDGKHILIS